ncbi:alpha/beta fold hydrolase [Mumia flava]|nr:alpha/beta hydrolase [Mumia flava]
MGRPTRVIPASGARHLAVCEWGVPTGYPVFWLHGTPGSRYTRHDSSVYTEAGARVITYDRPGYGQSTRDRGRDIAAAAHDIAAIAATLRLDEFAVAGRSGGGPHALAAAALLPDRVSRCASVVGVGPWDAKDLDWLGGMTQGNVDEYTWAAEGESILHERMEPRCREIVRAMAAGEGLGKNYELSPDDRATAADIGHRAMLSQAVQEAFRCGIWGLVDDDLAFTRPWGFAPDDVEAPTQVWYGTEDTLVGTQHGTWLLEHVPKAEGRVMEGGHLTLEYRADELMNWLANG